MMKDFSPDSDKNDRPHSDGSERVVARKSFMDRLIARRGHLIHKLKAKDTTGRWAYYFVLVMQDRESEFLTAIEGDGTLDLEDYGKVVASCYGEEPNEEIRSYLLEKYGFEV